MRTVHRRSEEASRACCVRAPKLSFGGGRGRGGWGREGVSQKARREWARPCLWTPCWELGNPQQLTSLAGLSALCRTSLSVRVCTNVQAHGTPRGRHVSAFKVFLLADQTDGKQEKIHAFRCRWLHVCPGRHVLPSCCHLLRHLTWVCV